MRRIAWVLLLLFTFTVPWEYSLELGEGLGNIARIVGLLLLVVAVPAVLQTGRIRTPGPVQVMALAFYLWLCCTYFWTIEPQATLEILRGYFQAMMCVWLVWEFAESPSDLRALLRAYVAGCWVLAILTVASLASPEAVAAGQIRFAATGQDPNDVARFLDLGLPVAVLLLNCETRWPARLLALGYLPLGLVSVLLTASRGGFLAALVALTGCGILLARSHGRIVLSGALALPAILAAAWLAVPRGTIERLSTIFEQLHGGDLNQRWNIWLAGWLAFVRAPVFGTGAGSFTVAAGSAPIDTAHNTALSILVTAGLCGLFLAVTLLAVVLHSALQTQGPLRIALVTLLTVWMTTSLVATVEVSRTTWLLLAIIALAGRLAVEEPVRLSACFAQRVVTPAGEMVREPVL
jgi:O-antigen ligase